jgi:hypothetical protein
MIEYCTVCIFIFPDKGDRLSGRRGAFKPPGHFIKSFCRFSIMYRKDRGGTHRHFVDKMPDIRK